MKKRETILLIIFIISLIISAVRMSPPARGPHIGHSSNEQLYESVLDSVLVDTAELIPHFELIKTAVAPVVRNPMSHFVTSPNEGHNVAAHKLEDSKTLNEKGENQ